MQRKCEKIGTEMCTLRIYVLRAQTSVRIAPPFNQVRVLELMDCWTAVMKKQEGRSNPHQSLTSDDVYP